MPYCYGQNCVPQNWYVESPTPRVTVFGEKAFMEIIKVKWGHNLQAGVLLKRGRNPRVLSLSLRCTEARPCEHATGRRQSTSQEGSPHQKYTGTCWHLNLLAPPDSRIMGNQYLLFESHGLVVFYYHRLSRPIHLSTHLYMFHPFNILSLNKQ